MGINHWSDDYFIRLERAAREILPYHREVSDDAQRLASAIIHECRYAEQIGLWVQDEELFASANYLTPSAFQRAVRQLEKRGVLHRKKWVESWWYEIRPHHEWRSRESHRARWRRYRAEIEIYKLNPSAITAYQSFWPTVAGKQAAKHSCPMRREGRDLFVACDGEAARAYLLQEDVRRLITERLRVKLREISRIHFVLEPLPVTGK